MVCIRDQPLHSSKQLMSNDTTKSGTSLRSPLSSNALQVFEAFVKATEMHPTNPELPAFGGMIGYEYLPLKKVCSVPAGATAFRSRGLQPNVIICIPWDNVEEGGADVEYARKIARGFKKIIEDTATKSLTEDENEYYVNYGKILIILSLF